MRKKHKKVCTTLNYFGHQLVLASACTSLSDFASLVGITVYEFTSLRVLQQD